MKRLPLAVIGSMAAAAAGQPLELQHRGSVAIATTATDQTGHSFTVTGLSGIARERGDDYLAVMDNSRYVVRLRVLTGDDGTITSAQILGGIRLADSRDFEGIAYTDSSRNSVLLSEEGTPAVHEYSLASGARLRSFTTPPVFFSRRANNGFESLTRQPLAVGRGLLWTANEEALTVDGPASGPAAGTTVRLLQYTFDRSAQQPGPQYAYVTQPWHGTSISGAKGGLSDLLCLPDGRLLALERSFAFSLSGLFQTRIYELDFAGATDVSGLPALAGQTFTPVSKRLLWSGFFTNLEGLTMGPALPGGGRLLLSIVDDGDAISTNALHAFVLTGDTGAPTAAPAERLQIAGPDMIK